MIQKEEIILAKQIEKYDVIEGQVSRLVVQPANVHFLKTIKREQKLAAAVAVGQAMAEQAGAVFSAQAAMDEGDPVESFSMALAGETVTGSFWKASFKEGEEIKAIGGRINGTFHATAIVDSKNRTIWMQPHCERGTKANSTVLIRRCGWFLIVSAIIQLILTINETPPIWPMVLGLSIATVVILVVTVGWSWPDFMAFSQEMNAVATALGWSNPAETDLFKTTRAARKAGKPELPMGVYYY